MDNFLKSRTLGAVQTDIKSGRQKVRENRYMWGYIYKDASL